MATRDSITVADPIMERPATIDVVASDVARPRISVVIPTYEPEHFLIDTVRSILAQDPGAAQMQIAIVDDCSPRTRAASLLKNIAPAGRIEFHEHADNLGLAGNWNRAIAHSRGRFIHILHQDDTVSAGFYTRLMQGIDSSQAIGMGFCRHAFIDEHDHATRISHRERWRAGVLPRWLTRIAEVQRIQCPSAIVRREAYETLGGFRSDLRFALDWEMWVRIASHYDVWHEPQVLAQYRQHGSTETSRLQAAGLTTKDMLRAIDVFSVHLPATQRQDLKNKAWRRLASLHTRRGAKALKAGSLRLAEDHLENARLVFALMTDSLATRWMGARLARLESTLSASSPAI